MVRSIWFCKTLLDAAIRPNDGETLTDDLALDEEEKFDLKTETGRKRHPDCRFTWSNSELRCAVRRYDYRLFRFQLRTQ